MDGLDYRLAGETFLILLGSLLAILLAALAFRRAREIQGLGYTRRNRNVVMARISYWGIILVLAFGTYFLFTKDIWAAYVAATLLGISVIATCFIRLPRPERERSLREQIARHAFVAWPWRHKWVGILGAFLIALFCILVYQRLDARQNRQAFIQARADIDKIYSQIVAKVGPPDNHRRTNECSRPSEEFEQGPLSCDVSTDFVYGVENQGQANKITLKIQAIILASGLLKPVPTPPSDIYITPAPSNYVNSQNNNYKTKGGLACSIKSAYDLPNEISIKINDSHKITLALSISCIDFAKLQIYPIHRPQN